jgi:hypothetical protein
MHCLEVTPASGWKHGAVELDETVQKVDIHQTVRSSYINSLVHTVEDVEFGCVVESRERREDHNARQPVVHKRFVIQTSHNRSENSISDRINACLHALRDVWQAVVFKIILDWSLAYK